MTEKKFVLEHARGGTGATAYKLVDQRGTIVYYAGEDTAPIFRASPDVEDRTRPDTRPDYSDVPVGTAGTATVRDYPSVRVFRHQLPSGSQQWLSAYPVEEVLVHADEHVTDFTPDVVLAEGLIEFVRTKLRDLGFNGDDRITVVNVLRDAS